MRRTNHIVICNICTIILIVLLVAVMAVSYFVNECDGGILLVLNVIPYLGVGMLVLTLSTNWPERTELVIVFLISCWLQYESIIGILQIVGLMTSNHQFYALTGNFSNPGPYGGFVAVCTAVCGAFALKQYKSISAPMKMVSRFAAASALMGFIMLPATMSRSAWLAIAISCAFVLSSFPVIKEWWRCGGVLFKSLAIALCCILVVGSFYLKTDSAIGRIHMWNMEMKALLESPLWGHGPNRALSAYGEAQAEYFAAAMRPATQIRIAGCPEYTFNEYLRFGLESGVAGLILSVGIILVACCALHKQNSSFEFGLLAIGIFAFASYPLKVWQLSILLAVFLGKACSVSGCRVIRKTGLPILLSGVLAVLIIWWRPRQELIINAEKRWQEEQRFVALGIDEAAADSLAVLYPLLQNNYRYLYDYGQALYKAEKYGCSRKILREGAALSSDPMFYNIMGKCFEAETYYNEAEASYMHAHFMVPSRLYPLILLMRMEIRRGNREKACAYANKILLMPINQNNKTMQNLRDEAKSFLDEVCSND